MRNYAYQMRKNQQKSNLGLQIVLSMKGDGSKDDTLRGEDGSKFTSNSFFFQSIIPVLLQNESKDENLRLPNESKFHPYKTC